MLRPRKKKFSDKALSIILLALSIGRPFEQYTNVDVCVTQVYISGKTSANWLMGSRDY